MRSAGTPPYCGGRCSLGLPMIRSALVSILTCLVATAAAAERPPVIGYLAAFKGMEAAADRVAFQQYTQINLAFANPDAGGRIAGPQALTCAPNGTGSMISRSAVRQLARKVHRSGGKLLLSLGGGVIPPCAGDWAKLLEPGSRDGVVRDLVQFVIKEKLDGIDVDLEGELMTRIDRAGNYTPFVQALATALHARGKLLTCATASYEGGMVPDASLPHFDFIGIMSYDAIGPTWGPAGSEHSTFAQAQRDLALWLAKGVPASKLALGVPFYGYGFGRYGSNYALSDIADQFGANALGRDAIGRACAGCDYITYNGLTTLRSKAALAAAAGAGVMVWEIGQDLPGHRAIQAVRAGLRDGAAADRR